MTPTFQSPPSLHASYSLLGRAFRAWTGDRLQGEALYIVAVTGGVLVLLMSHYLGWALLKPVLGTNPSWQFLFWGGQLASVALWGAIGLVGFRPGVTVNCSSSTVDIEQGGQSCTLSYDDITAVKMIPATTYHRHYRHYAATQVFASRFGDEVLLLRGSSGPVVIGLPELKDLVALQAHIETRDVDLPVPVPDAQS